MKYIQLSVSDQKVNFLLELLESMNFVTIHSVGSNDLPRVYPSLKLGSEPEKQSKEHKSSLADMNELRSIVNKIEQMRNSK